MPRPAWHNYSTVSVDPIIVNNIITLYLICMYLSIYSFTACLGLNTSSISQASPLALKNNSVPHS